MSQVSDELGERLARIVPELEPLDWDDVMERSQLLRRVAPKGRRGRLRIAPRALLFAVIVVLMGGSLALAFGGRVLTALDAPAPPAKVERSFEALLQPRIAGIHAMPDHVVRGSARRLLSVRTSRGITASLWISRTRAGRICYATVGKPFGPSGCTSPADPVRGAFLVLSWGSARHAATRIGWEMTLVGQVASPAARRVRLVYASGPPTEYPVVDRWFMLEVPSSHTTRRSEPVRIEVLSEGRTRLATRADPFDLRDPFRVVHQELKAVAKRLAP
jgi:hypothetical protein